MARTSPDDEPSKEEIARPKGRRRWRIALVGVAGLFVLLTLCLFVLPRYVVRLYVDHRLEELGLARSGIETIEFDLWSREILFGPVAIGKGDEPPARLARFALTFSLESLLFEKRGFTPTVIIEGVDLEITRAADGRLLLNDMPIFAPGDERKEAESEELLQDWGFGFGTLSLRNCRVVFHERAFEGGGTMILEIDRLDLAEFQTWTPEHPGQFSLDARVNDIGITVAGRATPFADQITFDAESTIDGAGFDKVERFTGPIPVIRAVGELTTRLKHEGTLKADGTLELVNAGRITLTGGELQLAERRTASAASIEVTFDLRNSIAPDLSGSVSGNLAVRAGGVQTIAPESANATIESFEANLEGIELSRWLVGRKSAISSVVAQAKLATRRWSFSGADGTTVDIGDVTSTITGLSVEHEPDGPLAAKLIGTAEATSLDATIAKVAGQSDLHLDLRRVALADIVARLTLEGEAGADWSISLSAVIDGIASQLADGRPLKLSASRMTVDEARHTAKSGFSAALLRMFGLNADIDQGIASALQGDEKTEDDEPMAWPVHIGELAIGDAATIRYTDTPAERPITITAKAETLRVEDLDSNGGTSKVTLEGTVNEFTPVRASGTVTPFARPPQFNLEARIEGASLPQFSPYTAKLAGLFVERGSLTFSGHGEVIESGKLVATVNLDVRDLEFGPVSKSEAEQLAARTGGLDPNVAANWLRDSQGKIELTIPVSGNLSEPQFDFEQVVSRAISGAIRSTISKTLKIVFPPALLISALQDSSRGIAIRPVVYQPLQSGFDGPDETLMSSLGDLLAKRPRLGITVCGRAVKADLEAFVAARAREAGRSGAKPSASESDGKEHAAIISRLQTDSVILQRARDELTILAHERTRIVRRELTDSYDIDAARIGECRAAFDPEDAGEPRTEIHF